MDIATLKKVYRKYGELFLHLFLLWFYFSALNVKWTEDWTSWDLHQNYVSPLAAIFFLVVFYLHTYWLFPRFFKKKKWLQYGFWVLLLCLSLEVGRSLFFIFSKPEWSGSFWSEFSRECFGYNHHLDAITNGFIASFAYVLAKDWLINQRLIEKLKAEKLSAELAYLKSQVDPHFLFNTLNRINALALEEDAHHTADGIAQLGTLMRYNLHDSKADYILLSKEIDYIQKYIDLQRLRTTEHNPIDFVVTIEDDTYPDTEIAPMLLIPFIENAFKYGISPTEKTFIRIEMKLKSGVFDLKVHNSIISNTQDKDQGGFGLQNVKKRLQLIYPDQYQLFCEKQQDIFKVRLEVNLKP